MDLQKIIDREDSLGNWRTATLLAFNGFLFKFVADLTGNDESVVFWKWVIPIIGLVFSISVYGSAIISCNVKYNAYKNSFDATENLKLYKLKQFFGPYMLSGLLMVLLWITYLALYIR